MMSKKHLLNEYSGGINYPNKMNKCIDFVKKIDIIIDYIYCLDDLFYYFNFDTEKEECVKRLGLNYCDIGIKLEIIRAFCIDELTNKKKLIKILEREAKGEQQ